MTESQSFSFQATSTPWNWYLFSGVPASAFWVNNVRAVPSDVQYCRVTPCRRCSLPPYGASNIYLHYHSWNILNLFSAPKVSGEMDNFLLRMCIHLAMASVHLTLNGNIFWVTSNRTGWRLSSFPRLFWLCHSKNACWFRWGWSLMLKSEITPALINFRESKRGKVKEKIFIFLFTLHFLYFVLGRKIMDQMFSSSK